MEVLEKFKTLSAAYDALKVEADGKLTQKEFLKAINRLEIGETIEDEPQCVARS